MTTEQPDGYNVRTNDGRPAWGREDSPFEKCDRCGKITVAGSAHNCNEANHVAPPTKRNAHERIALDDGDPDETVVVVWPARSDATYHRTEDGETPLDRCPANLRGEETEWRSMTRKRAQELDKAPCASCHDLGEKFGGDSG